MPKLQQIKKGQTANLIIRFATIMDYESIIILLKSARLPTQGVKENLDNFVVLTIGQKLVGAGGLEIYGDKGLLRSLAIHADYQNKGYGQQLYRRIVEDARNLNLTELYLLTETVEGFFASMGFDKISRDRVDEQIKTSEEYRSICPETAACMRLRL